MTALSQSTPEGYARRRLKQQYIIIRVRKKQKNVGPSLFNIHIVENQTPRASFAFGPP